MTITATKDITIQGPSDHIWILVSENSSNLTIGDDSHTIIFDGQNNAMSFSEGVVQRKNNTNLTLIKTEFKNFDLNNQAVLCLGENSSGVLKLENTTFTKCINPATGLIRNMRRENDKLWLKGYLNIDNECKGTGIYADVEAASDGSLKGRIKVEGTFTASNQISLVLHENHATYRPYIGKVVISSSVTQDLSTQFAVSSDNLSPVSVKYNSDKDMILAQVYTLKLDDAAAATMVLPFESTVPDGVVTCYTLTYPSGGYNITATDAKADGKLAANTPVLVIGTANTPYTFESTAAPGTAVVEIPGEEQTSGVLKGVYTETVVPADDYILTNHSGSLGFRKADGSNKVKAYHAYMTVSKSSGARSAFGIDFGDGTTSIADFEVEETLEDANAPVYNLQGVRMDGQTLQKGIYIKNGKKFIVK